MSDPYRQPGIVETEEPEPFPLEKILTVSARDYCESVREKLSDYEMKGVHAGDIDLFLEEIPRNTERVVAYICCTADFDHNKNYRISSGTALIPKPKE